jgi:hypothetical protein
VKNTYVGFYIFGEISSQEMGNVSIVKKRPLALFRQKI